MRKLILCVSFLILQLAGQVGARYLIVTHDNFASIIKPFAEWKHRTGMKTKTVKLSEIGYSAAEIRNYIVNAYTTWDIKPEYILFVGAPNFLPFPQVSGTYSDNYYTNMDGDIYNEILSGRLTAHDSIEAHTVTNKMLIYEKTPYLLDSTWFIKGCLIVKLDYDPDDSIYWSDIHHAAGLMVGNGFVLIDTLCDAYGHTSTDIINAVNDGRSILLYRGSGTNNWHAPFNVNPDLTSNGPKLPIVLSITCNTLGSGSTPAQAERWFLTGTPTNLRGASGYFATTTSLGSGARVRSAVAKGFFDAVFVDQERTFGEACEGGRLRAYSLYPSYASEYLGFTTVGDPEMALWTDTPCSLVVDYPQVIPIGGSSISVYVTQASNAEPVNNAFVCIAGKQDTNIYLLDTTDVTGYAYFNINPQVIDDTLFVTVSGKNLKPYEGNMITIVTNTPYIKYLKSSVDDSLNGNNDGFINPSETVNMALWVKNWSDSTGFGITGTLRNTDTLVTIEDSIKSFGDVVGHDSAFTGNDGYRFTVASSCPDLHVIGFDLICNDTCDSIWTSHFSKQVISAELIYQDAIISGGNGNSNFEPGETVTVQVILKNIGHGELDSIHAILRTTSPFIGINDSLGEFYNAYPDSIISNMQNPFVVYADTLTPQGTAIDFLIVLSSSYYHANVEFSMIVGKKDYYLWNPDPTPNPGENMHDILNALGYVGDIGLTLPGQLNFYQSLFVCIGVFPNNYHIDSGSIEAQAMRDFMVNRHGRVYMEGGDVWYYDPLYLEGYDFSSLFGLNATADGNPDMGPVLGVSGAFTENMFFGYGGENVWMDHISPAAGFLIARDDGDYDCGVAYNHGDYRTVATAFELGMLIDGIVPSTRAALLDSIMHFFAIYTGITEPASMAIKGEVGFEAYPIPFHKALIMQVNLCKRTIGKLVVYDITGRKIKTIVDDNTSLQPGRYMYTWNGKDDAGRSAALGVYMVRFESPDYEKTLKIIYIR